ncbi:response regulator transcription factor [Cytobacillus sp. FSL K6-0265]|uniref:response regulator transcription factor n=1 Tax=Cytobacillus sp. FSL K6-0265 TaxID=2921448 RepID=UPI0030F9FD49
MRKILLVDDEMRMLDLLDLYLSQNGFSCIKKTSGACALDYMEDHAIELVIIDVMMPDMDGWELCQLIKQQSDVPIIMLTAKGSKPDVVKGLTIGADDYIAKPFDEEELIARIEAVLRRTKATGSEIIFKELQLNKESYDFYYQKKKIPVTQKEFVLLELFLTHQNHVFSREHLITKIWGYGVYIEDRTVDSHIRNIREKLREVDFPIDQHLQTVWGIGYKWVS